METKHVVKKVGKVSLSTAARRACPFNPTFHRISVLIAETFVRGGDRDTTVPRVSRDSRSGSWRAKVLNHVDIHPKTSPLLLYIVPVTILPG